MKKILVPLCLFSLLTITAGALQAQTLLEMPEPPPPPKAPALRTVPASVGAASAQSAQSSKDAEPEVEENDIVRVSTSLITVPAEVLDRTGRFIGNLQKDDFRIYENGVEQELAY